MSIQFRTRAPSYPVNPETLMGACCNPEQDCTETNLRECYDSGGSFTPNTTCDSDINPCSDTGACCVAGICVQTNYHGCQCRGGNWLGKNISCNTTYDDPEVISESCCNPCDQEDANNGGSPTHGASGGGGADNGGPQACCVGIYNSVGWSGYCIDTNIATCFALGGSPRGPNTICSTITAAGGCGVTGATAHGACCVDGNCLSPDDDQSAPLHPAGYTPGDCSAIGGFWGGSGSTCGSGTTFDRGWPCSLPTGACCFGHLPFNGITYCNHGKTCGDCLNPPTQGGSGGLAWQLGSTCGVLDFIGEVSCDPPTENIGSCCIPEYFGSEFGLEPFLFDYICYQTTSEVCTVHNGRFNSEVSCDGMDCCETHGDCTDGPEGACCQFSEQNGILTYVQCVEQSAYTCNLLGSDPTNNLTTFFHLGEPCGQALCDTNTGGVVDSNSCCVFSTISGDLVGCFDMDGGVDTSCPPEIFDNIGYYGEQHNYPCFTGSCNSEMGACCREGSSCYNTSRTQCDSVSGIFYSGLDCSNNCGEISCCDSTSTEVIACWGDVDYDGCIDSYSYPSMDFNFDVAVNVLSSQGITPDFYSIHNNEGNYNSCENCNWSCSRLRSPCCWADKCIPNFTKNDCLLIGGRSGTCSGQPFVNIENSFVLSGNPCCDGQGDCYENECSFTQNTSIPSAPENIRAFSTGGTEGINYRRSSAHMRDIWDCTNPPCDGGNEDLRWNSHQSFLPAFVQLVWDPPTND